jgi:hypothetical protein
MEENTSTLNSRQTGTYHYQVTVPETGATKTAPTLESALTIILHAILKHLTTRSLILVLADQHADRAGRSVDPQERSQTDLEHQAALEVGQLGSAPQLKRREPRLVFELSRPSTQEQAAWLDEHVGKLFDSYCIKDELEIQLNTLLEEARDNRKAAAHE